MSRPTTMIAVLVSSLFLMGCASKRSLEFEDPSPTGTDLLDIRGIWQYEVKGSAILTSGTLRIVGLDPGDANVMQDNRRRDIGKVLQIRETGMRSFEMLVAFEGLERIQVRLSIALSDAGMVGTMQGERMAPTNDINNRREMATFNATRTSDP